MLRMVARKTGDSGGILFARARKTRIVKNRQNRQNATLIAYVTDGNDTSSFVGFSDSWTKVTKVAQNAHKARVVLTTLFTFVKPGCYRLEDFHVPEDHLYSKN